MSFWAKNAFAKGRKRRCCWTGFIPVKIAARGVKNSDECVCDNANRDSWNCKFIANPVDVISLIVGICGLRISNYMIS